MKSNPGTSLAHTGSKSKEETFVRVLLQQVLHPLPHPLIPLVDELLAEVIIYLLGSNALMRRQRGVNEIGDLVKKEKVLKEAILCIFK